MEGIILWYLFSKTNTFPPIPHPDDFHNEISISRKSEDLIFGALPLIKGESTSFTEWEIPDV